MRDHVALLVEYRNGEPLLENVEAEALGNGCYRLLFSPGFVQGIAAGDEFKLLNEDGEFEVIKRAGNVVVQVFSNELIEPYKDELTKTVENLGGTLDGSIERGMVFTIPVAAGFKQIESLFNEFIAKTPTTQWLYGNVYDQKDGKTPLNWWLSNENE